MTSPRTTATPREAVETTPARKSRLIIALILLVLAWLPYSRVHLPSMYNCGDNLWIVPTAMSIVRHGDIDLNEYHRSIRNRTDVWINHMPIDPRLVKVNGRFLMLHPIGSPFAVLPFVAAHNALRAPAADPMQEAINLTPRIAPWFAIASVGLLFLLLGELGATRTQAILITLIFAFATPHYVTHADGLWSHNIFLPFLITTLLLLARGGPIRAALAGLTAAFGYLIRPESSILIICLVIWLLTTNWRRAIPFILAGGVAGIAFLLWSHHAYAAWLPPYYIRKGSDLPLAQLLPGLLNQLFSPNRGITMFSPILLFGLAATLLVWLRRPPNATLYRAISIMILAQLAMISCYKIWWAGVSYGPRYFCPVIPLYIILLLPLWQLASRAPRNLRTAIATLAIAASVWGLFVNIRGITDPRTHDWNHTPVEADFNTQRFWDWRDLQILRDWP